MVAVDLDSDARLDVVAGSSGGFLRGLGEGRLDVATSLVAVPGNSFLRPALVAGDAIPDLVVARRSGSVQVSEGVAAGFGEVATYDGVAVLLAIADVDDDGWLDLATVGGGTLAVLGGNGDGSFDPAPSWERDDCESGSTLDLAVTDLDPGGGPDLVLSCSQGLVVHSFGEEGAYLGRTDLPTAGVVRGYDLVSGDLTGDGWSDLAVQGFTEEAPQVVAIWPGLGAGALGEPAVYELAHTTWTVVAADLDEDGVSDLVVADPSEVACYLADGAGGFVVPDAVIPDVAGPGLLVADLDGDGAADVVGHDGAGRFDVALGRGDGTFGPATRYAAVAPDSLAAADVNGDGLPDLVASSEASRALLVLANAGGGRFRPPVQVPLPIAPLGLAAADLDHEGPADLVAWSYRLNQFAVVLTHAPLLLRAAVLSGAPVPIPAGGGQAAAESPVSLGQTRFEEPRLLVRLSHPDPTALRLALRAPPPAWAPDDPPATVVLKEAGVPAAEVLRFPDPPDEALQPDLAPLSGLRSVGEWTLVVSDPDAAPDRPEARLDHWRISGIARD